MPSRAHARAALVLTLALIGCGWAAGAWAQAEIAGKAADTFLSRGEYGALVVVLGCVIVAVVGLAGAVIRFLYNRNEALTARLEAVAEKAAQGLNAVADAAARDREVMQELRASMETRAQTLGDLNNLVSLSASRVDHGFAQSAQVMTTVAERLKELRDDLRDALRGRNGDRP